MKRYFMFIVLLFTFLLLAACGTSEKDADADNQVGDETEETEKPDEKAQDEKQKITEAGIYNGQADPHTIEIETAEGPTAFQLTMEARKDVDNLTEGDEVTFTYYKDGEQLVIESIKSNAKSGSESKVEKEKITESGVYTGQADPHTIEIETEKGPTAFQLTMEARGAVEKLTEGNKVTYTYYKDGEQLVIESIKNIGDDNEKLTETGVYNGQADLHTIEIETEKGPTAFQLTMEARYDVEKLQEGGEVTYTYYKDGEQLVIEKIEMKK